MFGTPKMPSDYESAALRHYRDAEQLAGFARYDNAGHLIGFAAECALKKAGQGYLKGPKRDIDGHLPGALKATIRRELQGRNMTGQLLALVLPTSRILYDWDVNSRYGCDGSVTEEQYRRWLADTRKVFAAARIRYKAQE